MRNLISRWSNKWDVTPAVLLGITNKVWSSASGLVVVGLISRFFTPEQQGFYYSYSSLLGLQGLFELGLSTVMLQFFAHEFTYLRWDKKGHLVGKGIHQERVLEVMQTGIRWLCLCAILFMLTIVFSSRFLFDSGVITESAPDWKIPLLWAALGVGLNLTLIPLYAILTGSGEVAESSRIELGSSVFAGIAAWLTIFFGGGLYALSALSLTKFVFSLIVFMVKRPLLLRHYGQIFKGAQSRTRKKTNRFSWLEEFWPMQWRIALSWISGYFIFQLFVPVLLKTHGPVIAGQMGMTLSMTNAIQSIGILWFTTRAPEYGRLIAQNAWHHLDPLFKRTQLQALVATTLIAALFLLILWELGRFMHLADRLLPLPQIALLLIATLCQVQISSWAVYMRAHKQETMAKQSLIGAALTAPSIIIFGTLYSSWGMVTSFAVISIFYGIPSTYLIWHRFIKTRSI